jgi:hypothetical protein
MRRFDPFRIGSNFFSRISSTSKGKDSLWTSLGIIMAVASARFHGSSGAYSK